MQAMHVKVENLSAFSLAKKISRAETILSKEAQWVLYRVLLIFSDIFMTGTAFLLSYLVRFTNPFNIFDNTALISYENYRSLIYILLPLWLLIFAVNGLYNKQNLLGGTREYASVFRSANVGSRVRDECNAREWRPPRRGRVLPVLSGTDSHSVVHNF